MRAVVALLVSGCGRVGFEPPRRSSTRGSANRTHLDVTNIVIRNLDGSVAFETTNTNTNFDYLAPGTVNLRGAWHHVAATWDGDTKRLYVDGVFLGMQSTLRTDSVERVLVRATRDFGSPTLLFDGDMDELELYSVALEEGAIAGLASR